MTNNSSSNRKGHAAIIDFKTGSTQFALLAKRCNNKDDTNSLIKGGRHNGYCRTLGRTA